MSDFDMLPAASVFSLPYKTIADSQTEGRGGNGFISGKVTESGLAVARRVLCYHRRTGKLCGTTWSDENGYYIFNGLIAKSNYYVTSIDENLDAVQYNAVTQDLIEASEVV